jgi:hypothetical protein
MSPTCQCGAPLPQNRGRGRPRVRCEACASNKSNLAREWRASHPDEVAAQNLVKRLRYRSTVGAVRARRRLKYALRIGRRISQATLDVERAMKKAA